MRLDGRAADEERDGLGPRDKILFDKIADEISLVKAAGADALVRADERLHGERRLPCPWPRIAALVLETMKETFDGREETGCTFVFQTVEDGAEAWVMIKADGDESV